MSTESVISAELTNYGRIVGLFTLGYCIPGLATVATLLRSEIKYNNFNAKPFTILIVNSLIADVVFLLLFIFYAAPCDLLVDKVYGSIMRTLAGFCQSYIFSVSLFINMVITANRFTTIFYSKAADRIFDKRGTHFIAFATWIGAALSIAVLDVWLKGCSYFYDEKQFIFYATCDTTRDNVLLSAVPVLSLGVMGILYFMCLLKLKYENSKVSNETIVRNMAKKRMKVFWQAFGIWASMLMNVLSYHFISPYMKHILVNGIVSVVLILCPTYGSCVIILIFDKKMRQCLQSIYKSNVIHTQTAMTAAVR
uniref:7TM GPCR serpentine receptor class x (Srx) domain-containing protein n=1 Tax=Romanomermis culicivorax TaxID=13658 RepID=A0A915HH86_ROMCU